MPKSSNRDRPTSLLVAAANILQALSPSRLGLLLVLYDNDTQTQKDISDLIGRTQSTISTYLQSLGTLSRPLAAKQGRYYTITNTGGKVVGLVNTVFRRCGLELRSIDWTDENERKTVEELLTPLHDSQIMRPFFILDSLYVRSDIDGLLGTPQPIRFDDIVQDVEIRQEDIGENVTTEEIRRTVKQRFIDTGIARFEEGEITLTDKGHCHAWLWHELIQYLKKQDEIDSAEEASRRVTAAETTAESLDEDVSSSPSPTNSNQTDEPSRVLQQSVAERFDSGRQSLAEQRDTSEQPSIIPVYTLSPNEEDREHPTSSPKLPLTAKMTIEDLTASLNRLANEYDEDTELTLEWMVQTESGIYPLASADSRTSNTLQLQNR